MKKYLSVIAISAAIILCACGKTENIIPGDVPPPSPPQENSSKAEEMPVCDTVVKLVYDGKEELLGFDGNLKVVAVNGKKADGALLYDYLAKIVSEINPVNLSFDISEHNMNEETISGIFEKVGEIAGKNAEYRLLGEEYKIFPEHTVEVIDGVTYIDGVLIVNKSYSLPKDYGNGLDSEAKSAFDMMKAAAKKDGISLKIASGYRSYKTQNSIYRNYRKRDGDLADIYSARPGYSEHQTGLAMDINRCNNKFGETPEGKWLAAHCSEYGFIIRYPRGKEDITGYQYEPWHIRYLGTELAKKVEESGLCLEEYFGIDSVYKTKWK